MKKVITYGTFDLLHYGHIYLLEKAKNLAEGGQLLVGLSTDEFNLLKGKRSYYSYAERYHLLSAIKYVDVIFPERSWNQKCEDIEKYGVDVFVMGSDWRGKFDFLKDFCEVVYLERTKGVSSTLIKQVIQSDRGCL